MSFRTTQTLKTGKSKLVAGVMVAVMTAAIGTASAGVAHATNGGGGTVPQNKKECMEGGWKKLGWKNQGQCVSSVVSQKNKQGGGYGNGPQLNVNANIVGNNNVLHFVINWIIGS